MSFHKSLVPPIFWVTSKEKSSKKQQHVKVKISSVYTGLDGNSWIIWGHFQCIPDQLVFFFSKNIHFISFWYSHFLNLIQKVN